MRWALSRTAISCFGGPVPQKPNRSSIEGSLLHELIERFESSARQPGDEVFRPRRTLLDLVAAWSKNNAANRRIDSKALAGQVRLEEILRAFGEACDHVKVQERQPTGFPSSAGSRPRVFNGAESWLRDRKSKLCGRADFISNGEITDFKNGEQHAHHVEQIVFYGALYLALTGRTPTALRLIYTATSEIREVPVPALGDLQAVLEEMRLRAAWADCQVAGGALPATPEPAKCADCHVRGLCDKYWQWLPKGSEGESRQATVSDYAPSTAAVVESAALGVYIRDKTLGIPSALHLPRDVAEKMGDGVRRMRVLALRTKTGTEGLRFIFTQSSEIYVS